MPVPKRHGTHSYSLYVALHASEEVKQRGEHAEDESKQPGRDSRPVILPGFPWVEAIRCQIRCPAACSASSGKT